MKLGGYRTDGTLRVLIPGGMTVLLSGDTASPPIDDRVADGYGPWIDPPVSLTWNERQELGKRLDRSRVAPLHTFALKDAPVDAPAETEVAPAMTKGDLLKQITEIANAQAAAKEAKPEEKADEKKPDAPPARPRNTLKRLKLEFESEDREVEDEKPVSDVAAAAPSVPDHLQPMEKSS